MKNTKLLTVVFVLFLSTSVFSQKKFLSLTAGYSSLSSNDVTGYTVRTVYSSRFLGLFRIGVGLEANNFMNFNQGLLMHITDLEADLSGGVAFKLFGFRLEGGAGLSAGFWQRSFATDVNTSITYFYANQNYTLSSATIVTYNDLAFGTYLYGQLAIDLTNKLGLIGFVQAKYNKLGDRYMNYGGGLYYLLRFKSDN